MIMRLFASTYPHEVRASSPSTPPRRSSGAPSSCSSPGRTEPARRGEVSIQEGIATMWRARADKPLRPMPMIVLEHSRDRRRVPNPFDAPPSFPILPIEQAWQTAQDDLAALVPHTRHIIATPSSYYIQLDQPELVIRSIRAVARDS